MKKRLAILLLIIMSVTVMAMCALALSACGLFYRSISTVEELYAMKSGGSYRLECDIDLQEREWASLDVKNFDGGGHTISNVFMPGNDGGFFKTVMRDLKNVTFDNMSASIMTDEEFVGVVANEIFGYCENVSLKNSTAVVSASQGNYFGGISSRSGSAKNVHIINCDIKYTGKSGAYFGGVFGFVTSYNSDFGISDCSAESSAFEIKNDYSIAFGNIVGNYGGDSGIGHCKANNMTVTIMLNKANSAAFVGGIVGLCGSSNSKSYIENCLAADNQIELNTGGGYYIGGIVGYVYGTVKNCLSSDNDISGSTNSDSSASAYIGGLCGYNANTVSKCISQNCVLSGYVSGSIKGCSVSGFAANPVGSVVECASKNNKVTGNNSDIFSSKEGTIINCVVSDVNGASNANSVPTVEGWRNIISVLNLDDNIWQFDGLELGLNI